MTKTIFLAAALAALLIAGGCQSPTQPGCDGPPPGAQVPPGLVQSNTPKVGTMPGAPGWVNVYGREKVDMKNEFRPISGQAGSVNNNQGLGNLTSSFASVPASLKAAASCLETLNVQLAGCAPGSEAWKSCADRINTTLEVTQRMHGDWLESAGIHLAPRIENVLVFNTAGVGSSNEAPHPITDAKVESMAKNAGEAAAMASKAIVDLKKAKPGSVPPAEDEASPSTPEDPVDPDAPPPPPAIEVDPAGSSTR